MFEFYSQVVASVITPDRMTPDEILLLTEFKTHPDSMYISDDGNVIYTTPGADVLVKMERFIGRNFNELSDDELNTLVNQNYELIADTIEDED